MNASVNLTTNTAVNLDSISTVINKFAPETQPDSVHETSFNLGLWLSGLESFLRIRSHAFAETNQSKSASRDWSKEFSLTHLALLMCSDAALRLSETAQNTELTEMSDEEIDIVDKLNSPESFFNFSFEDIFALSVNLKNLVLLNETLLRAAPHRLNEWKSWSEILCSRLEQTEAAVKFIEKAERDGEKYLPPALVKLFQNASVAPAVEADFQVILPHFAKILRWLDVIGKMLENDEPLKLSLLIFARIYEQMQTAMSFLNNRLLRFENKEAALYNILDGALYAASIELRKVFNFELAGLAEMRQPVSIRAKVETAYALLNDCIQLILVQFAQFVEPDFEPTGLFPNFQTKLEQSLALRRDLWSIQQVVKKTEQNPDNVLLEKLNDKLDAFLKSSLRFLMYKDCETFERFTEEVMRTRSKKDLVPILHRFGAYLETLLGQVSMRTVLADHPFDYPKE